MHSIQEDANMFLSLRQMCYVYTTKRGKQFGLVFTESAGFKSNTLSYNDKIGMFFSLVVSVPGCILVLNTPFCSMWVKLCLFWEADLLYEKRGWIIDICVTDSVKIWSCQPACMNSKPCWTLCLLPGYRLHLSARCQSNRYLHRRGTVLLQLLQCHTHTLLIMKACNFALLIQQSFHIHSVVVSNEADVNVTNITLSLWVSFKNKIVLTWWHCHSLWLLLV